MIKKHHLVCKIQKLNDQFVLECTTSKKQYSNIGKIIVKGDVSRECFFKQLDGRDKTVNYQVIIPTTDLEGACAFYVIKKNSKEKRVWKPAPDLIPETVPDGFYFSNRFINLTYENDKNLTAGNWDPQHFVSVLTGIKRNQNKVHLSGYLFLPYKKFDLDSLKLKIIKFRQEDVSCFCDVHVRPAKGKIFNRFRVLDYNRFNNKEVFLFTCDISLEDITKFSGFFNFIFEHAGRNAVLKNYNDPMAREDRCYPVRRSLFRRALFVPYCDDSVNVWRLDIYHLSWWEWVKLRVLYRKCAKGGYKKDEKIWLIGEYTSTARDNGMHFFHYMRKRHSEIDAYYVIYRDSEQVANLKDKNVLFYGSYRHFKISNRAGTLVFTHRPNYLLPKLDRISGYLNNYSKFNTVFIQHGIIATTASVNPTRKEVYNFDRYIVSSELEKSFITTFLGYSEKEVVVTGLARWDNLRKIMGKTTDILLMPTWRNDLAKVDETAFMESDYYSFWDNLLTDERLLDFLRRYDVKIKFFLHIRLSRFSNCFRFSDAIENANGENIQKLLSSCGMLVTDYSSVAFDVLFQDKPVIFCPFDYDAMMTLRKGPKFIDYEKDLPSPICYTVESTVKQIIDHAVSNYSIKGKYKERRKKFFDYIDSNNCERLYNEISLLLNEKNTH